MNRRLFFKELFTKTAVISSSSVITSNSISELQTRLSEVTDNINEQVSKLWDLMEIRQKEAEEFFEDARKRIDGALVDMPHRMSQIEFQQNILFLWCLVLSVVVGIDLSPAWNVLN